MAEQPTLIFGSRFGCANCRVENGECPHCGRFWYRDEPTGKLVCIESERGMSATRHYFPTDSVHVQVVVPPPEALWGVGKP